jgi:hypothetical protein
MRTRSPRAQTVETGSRSPPGHSIAAMRTSVGERLTLWQRMGVRWLRRQAGRREGEPLEPEDWEEIWRLHGHGVGHALASPPSATSSTRPHGCRVRRGEGRSYSQSGWRLVSQPASVRRSSSRARRASSWHIASGSAEAFGRHAVEGHGAGTQPAGHSRASADSAWATSRANTLSRAFTTSGSNWLPAQRSSSARACSWVIEAW